VFSMLLVSLFNKFRTSSGLLNFKSNANMAGVRVK
jgi:hypothetical protein